MADDAFPTEALLDGRYQLGACVGQGGMARVHRAHDVLLDRTVAIKILRSDADGDSASDRARSEMTVLASLSHPALVTLFDAQLTPGRSEYLVMEFVDGPTLSARIAQGAIPSAEVADLASDLAAALDVVHGAGIVHRDVKPSNVLLSPLRLPGTRSGAKLADFGISVLVDAARLTSPGVVVGTAAYLAPEQLRGAPPAPSADIYSLGLVLLEALTGERAFKDAEGIGAAMARLIEEPEVPPSVGPDWSRLLRRMMATDPDARPNAYDVYATASEIGNASAPSERPAPQASRSPGATDTPGLDSGASTAVLPMMASAHGRGEERSRRRRRVGLRGGVAAATVAASVLTGVWLAGSGGPHSEVRNPSDVEQSPAATTPSSTPPADVTTVNDPEETKTRDAQDDGVVTKGEQKAADEESTKAAKNAQKAEQEQKKADREREKGG